MLFFSILLLTLLNFWLLIKNRHVSLTNSPIKILGVALAIYYTIPAIFLGCFDYKGRFFTTNPNLYSYQNFVIIAFLVSLLATTFLITKKQIRSINYNYDNLKVRTFSLILIVIGLSVKLFLYNKGLYSLEDVYNKDYLKIPRHLIFLRNIDLWGFYILSTLIPKYLWKRSKYKLKLIYFGYLFFIVGFSIIQGRRSGAIIPVFIFMLSYSSFFKIKVKSIVLTFITIIILISITTFNRISEAGIKTNIKQAAPVLIDAVFTRLSNSYIILNKIIDTGPTYKFTSFSSTITGLVPSFLYKDKPSISIGNKIGKELGLINIKNVKTGINPGWIGEGYYNYGLLGVIISGSVLAILMYFFFHTAKSVEYDSARLFRIMIFILLITGFQMEIAASANNYLKGTLMMIFITGFIPRLKLI